MPAAPSEEDALLYGRDATAGLLGFHPAPSGDAPGETMRVYHRRPGRREVLHTEAPFHPFFFLSDLQLLAGYPRERVRVQRLQEPHHYAYLVVFSTRSAYWEAVRHVEAQARRTGQEAPLYRIASPVQQYLMQTGRTGFKGMAFEDLHRLQLDIEAYAEGGFPDPSRPDCPVIIVALSDNRGWRQVLHLAPDVPLRDGRGFISEADLLRALVDVIRDRDPDVIEGHNIYAFDFPYLMTRCRRHGVPFAIGRDGAVPRTFPTSMRFAERTIDFPALDIAGRHVIDTYFQVMAYDVFKRHLPGYGLKAAARYFGFAAPERTYVEGDRIAAHWRADPARVLAYAADDVYETERLARHLSPSTFYLAQMVPMPYGQVARTGPAAKIEALFVREYLRRRHSLPRPGTGSQALGGYTDVFVTGAVGPVVYADVESLYPSIMLRYDVRPAADTLGLFPALLRRLTALRLDAKAAMQAAESDEARSALDARQASYKNLINSFYGNLGFSRALFNDHREADRVAATGQELLRTLIDAIRREGGRVIEVDTDGVLFVPPPGVRGESAERAFVAARSAELPEGIHLGFDGRFRKMLSYKKKNYALLAYDGHLSFKGSSLVSRSIERFGRRFVREAIRLLLEEDVQGLHELYIGTRARIEQHDWEGVDDFARTERLRDTLAQYDADVAAGKRPRAAAYELARQAAQRTGRPPRKGDRIRYYVTGTSAQVTSFENARPAEDWDPDRPDENTAFYLKRLDEFAQKLGVFFEPHDFRLIFSPEDLFGFSPEGIRVRTVERAPEDLEDEVPF